MDIGDCAKVVVLPVSKLTPAPSAQVDWLPLLDERREETDAEALALYAPKGKEISGVDTRAGIDVEVAAAREMGMF